jgi:hypothetical protein
VKLIPSSTILEIAGVSIVGWPVWDKSAYPASSSMMTMMLGFSKAGRADNVATMAEQAKSRQMVFMGQEEGWLRRSWRGFEAG